MMRSSTNRSMIRALQSSSTPIVPPSSSLLPLSSLPSSSLSYTSLPLSSRLSLRNNSFSSSLYSSSPSFRSFSSSTDTNKQETTNNNNNTTNTDNTTNNNQSSSSSSTSSSPSSSSSPSPSPFNLFSFLRSEADHIKEFATKKFGLLPPKKKRSLEEFKIKYDKEVKERDKLLKQRYPAGGAGAGKIPLSGTQTKKINNKEEEIKNDRKELILAEEKLTVWERRWRNFRSSFEETTIIKSVKGVQRKVATSDNKIINNPLIADVKQTIEEAKDIWESQDPIINNIRNIGDKIFGETETGFAIGEAKKRDPSFNLLDFMEEMEHYFAPIVVEAWRKGDIYLMNKITEGRAKAYILGNFRGRAEKFEKWDDRILDLKGFDFTGASVQQDTPVFTFYFLAQHVDHTIDIRNQNTVRGSEYNINTHYYVFMVTQDKTNPDFDYKVIDFVAQEIKELGASSSSSTSQESEAAAKKAGSSTKTSSEKSSDKQQKK